MSTKNVFNPISGKLDAIGKNQIAVVKIALDNIMVKNIVHNLNKSLLDYSYINNGIKESLYFADVTSNSFTVRSSKILNGELILYLI